MGLATLRVGCYGSAPSQTTLTGFAFGDWPKPTQLVCSKGDDPGAPRRVMASPASQAGDQARRVERVWRTGGSSPDKKLKPMELGHWPQMLISDTPTFHIDAHTARSAG